MTGLCIDEHGAVAALPDMPLAPFDIDTEPSSGGPPLRRYQVTRWGYTTVMQLNDQDAAAYGADAVLLP